MPQRIIISAVIDDERADPADDTGVTDDAHQELLDALLELGLDDVDIRKG